MDLPHSNIRGAVKSETCGVVAKYCLEENWENLKREHVRTLVLGGVKCVFMAVKLEPVCSTPNLGVFPVLYADIGWGTGGAERTMCSPE